MENLTKVLFFQSVSIFIVRGCRSVTVKGKNIIRFHRVARDKKKGEKWMEVCDINDFVGFVCARHLEATTFEYSLK